MSADLKNFRSLENIQKKQNLEDFKNECSDRKDLFLAGMPAKTRNILLMLLEVLETADDTSFDSDSLWNDSQFLLVGEGLKNNTHVCLSLLQAIALQRGRESFEKLLDKLKEVEIRCGFNRVAEQRNTGFAALDKPEQTVFCQKDGITVAIDVYPFDNLSGKSMYKTLWKKLYDNGIKAPLYTSHNFDWERLSVLVLNNGYEGSNGLPHSTNGIG